jgi:hypothetical protein
MNREIKVGILVSYDYELLRNSLPPIYEYADKIVLAVDIDGKTWAGNPLSIPDSFWQWIKDFDVRHKIEIYKDSFCVEGLSTMQCEIRERNMLAKYMGEGGWHVQVDSDEYFVDFKDFVKFLHYLDEHKKHINTVFIEWLYLYKKTEKGYLCIKGNGGQVPCATTRPYYILARINKNAKSVHYPQRIIHDSWARTEQDLWKKLTNWGHNTDFNIEGYFNYWKVIDESNYMFARNIHPLLPHYWKELEYVEAKDISDLLQYLKEDKNNTLIKATKPLKLIYKIIQLCIPPIFDKIHTKYIKKSKT